ncbi:MAG: hypothetical protein JSV85_00110 [Candidatus Bathyarchaeota archaeon]|nr:MAG: hypothetical protein JSV85_00110 [Candidatus Bathyarchaeota archaeon]
MAENSTLCGTHVSGTEPQNWAPTQPGTQVVWGSHSKITREHRLFAGPDFYVLFYDETNKLVLSVMTSALGDASVNIVYSVGNCTSALRVGCATFNIVSKGPFKMTKLMGDIDKDEVVDIDDLTQLGKAYGSSEGSSSYDLEADLDCDGRVDVLDLMVVCRYWGYAYGIIVD